MKNVEDDVDSKAIKHELRQVVDTVRDRAQRNVEHKTGRHGQDGPIKVRTSVTAKGASVFANAPHSAVQDQGGQVGHGALIPRARASHYMTRAVKDSQRDVTEGLVEVGKWIEREFGKG